MAARNFAPLRALDREVVKVFGGGTGGGAAANMSAIKGAGVSSIAYNAATGKYRITLADKFNSLLMASFLVIDPAAGIDDWEVVIEAEDVASAKTIDIAVFKGGALADMATTEKLKFELSLSNTAQAPTAR